LISHHSDELSGAMSAAATDPTVWPTFLEMLASGMDSNAIGLHWETMDRSRRGSITLKFGLAATFTSEYERYYAPRNPIIAHAGDLIVPGQVLPRQEVCPDETFRSSEFYNDFLKPNDVLQILGGTIARRGPDVCMISICGSHRRKAFERPEVRLLEALMPQLRTALVLQDRLGMMEQRLQRVEAAFNSVPDAAILVDGKAIVLAANDAAHRMLAERDGLYIEQDRLRIRDRTRESSFAQILNGIALAKEFNLETSPGRALRVARPSGAPDWLIQIIPVERKMAGAAVLFLTSAAMPDAPAESDLADLYDLSPMQRQGALRLFPGSTPDEIGEGLRITRNTLKTHLRRLYLKLGISRQSDLMALFSKLKPRRNAASRRT
jgi:DNA-binding CsgD family transcriptional regulator